MYAIVDIQGQQFKIEKDNTIFVHRLSEKEGEQIEFEKVLLIEDGDNVSVGTPFVKKAKISAKVLKHVKGDKVKVFKKKRRKGYQKLNGHRQYFSQILIEDILIDGEKKQMKPATKEIPETNDEKKEEIKVAENKNTKPQTEKKEETKKEEKTETQNKQEN